MSSFLGSNGGTLSPTGARKSNSGGGQKLQRKVNKLEPLSVTKSPSTSPKQNKKIPPTSSSNSPVHSKKTKSSPTQLHAFSGQKKKHTNSNRNDYIKRFRILQKEMDKAIQAQDVIQMEFIMDELLSLLEENEDEEDNDVEDDTDKSDVYLRENQVKILENYEATIQLYQQKEEEEVQKHRFKGNALMRDIAFAMEQHENIDKIRDLLHQVLQSYKRARDKRWECISTIEQRALAENMMYHACQMFEEGEIEKALAMGTEAQEHDQKYTHSKHFQQAQLLLNLSIQANPFGEWQQQSQETTATTSSLSVSKPKKNGPVQGTAGGNGKGGTTGGRGNSLQLAFKDLMQFFREKAHADASNNFEQAKKYFQTQEFQQALRCLTKYRCLFAWLNQTVPNTILKWEQKIKKQQITYQLGTFWKNDGQGSPPSTQEQLSDYQLMKMIEEWDQMCTTFQDVQLYLIENRVFVAFFQMIVQVEQPSGGEKKHVWFLLGKERFTEKMVHLFKKSLDLLCAHHQSHQYSVTPPSPVILVNSQTKKKDSSTAVVVNVDDDMSVVTTTTSSSLSSTSARVSLQNSGNVYLKTLLGGSTSFDLPTSLHALIRLIDGHGPVTKNEVKIILLGLIQTCFLHNKQQVYLVIHKSLFVDQLLHMKEICGNEIQVMEKLVDVLLHLVQTSFPVFVLPLVENKKTIQWMGNNCSRYLKTPRVLVKCLSYLMILCYYHGDQHSQHDENENEDLSKVDANLLKSTENGFCTTLKSALQHYMSVLKTLLANLQTTSNSTTKEASSIPVATNTTNSTYVNKKAVVTKNQTTAHGHHQSKKLSPPKPVPVEEPHAPTPPNMALVEGWSIAVEIAKKLTLLTYFIASTDVKASKIIEKEKIPQLIHQQLSPLLLLDSSDSLNKKNDGGILPKQNDGQNLKKTSSSLESMLSSTGGSDQVSTMNVSHVSFCFPIVDQAFLSFFEPRQFSEFIVQLQQQTESSDQNHKQTTSLSPERKKKSSIKAVTHLKHSVSVYQGLVGKADESKMSPSPKWYRFGLVLPKKSLPSSHLVAVRPHKSLSSLLQKAKKIWSLVRVRDATQDEEILIGSTGIWIEITWLLDGSSTNAVFVKQCYSLRTASTGSAGVNAFKKGLNAGGRMRDQVFKEMLSAFVVEKTVHPLPPSVNSTHNTSSTHTRRVSAL